MLLNYAASSSSTNNLQSRFVSQFFELFIVLALGV
jgi:hypothetical protein